jgi:hypothetical protein
MNRGAEAFFLSGLADGAAQESFLQSPLCHLANTGRVLWNWNWLMVKPAWLVGFEGIRS